MAVVTICQQMSAMHVMDPLTISFGHKMDGDMGMTESSSPDHIQFFWSLMPGLVQSLDFLSFLLILGAFFFTIFRVDAFSKTVAYGVKQKLHRWMYFESFPALLFAFQNGIIHPKRFS